MEFRDKAIKNIFDYFYSTPCGGIHIKLNLKNSAD